jgi:hypothetical protein
MHVYQTLAHNTLASRMLINQLTPCLPKDNEEVNAHVKRLQAMLDTATVVDLVLDRDGEVRGDELDHRQSPHGDTASCLTPLEECSQRQDWDNQDLCDIIVTPTFYKNKKICPHRSAYKMHIKL